MIHPAIIFANTVTIGLLFLVVSFIFTPSRQVWELSLAIFLLLFYGITVNLIIYRAGREDKMK